MFCIKLFFCIYVNVYSNKDFEGATGGCGMEKHQSGKGW